MLLFWEETEKSTGKREDIDNCVLFCVTVRDAESGHFAMFELIRRCSEF